MEPTKEREKKTMEAELLRGMIADRDERIGRMERRLLEQQTKHEQVAQTLEEVSTENQIARTQLQTERTQCRSTYEEARGNLEHLQRDLQQQGSSLQQAYTTFSKRIPPTIHRTLCGCRRSFARRCTPWGSWIVKWS